MSHLRPIELFTERLRLTIHGPGDVADVARFLQADAARFARWDPPMPPDPYTAETQQRIAARARNAYQSGDRLPLIARLKHGGPGVVAMANFSNVQRGAFQSCQLGYKVASAYEGQGMMAEALRAGIAHIFGVWNLHRIAANYRPENARSGRLLERLGFEREGLARRYLFIDGAWRDHVLTALYNDDAPDPAGGG